MTKNSSDFITFILEQLGKIPQLAQGRFFGGTSLMASGIQFAILMDNSVYFVVDVNTRTKYVQLGSDCFSYNTAKRHVNVKRYYEVPACILEEQDEFVVWANESIQIARESESKTKQLKSAK